MIIRYDAIFSNKMVLFVSLLYEVKWMLSRLKTYTLAAELVSLSVFRITAKFQHCLSIVHNYKSDTTRVTDKNA